MTGIDLLWLAGIAGVWYLLGTKRRREERRHRNSPSYVKTFHRDDSLWIMVTILCVIAIFFAIHH